ncbi:hypothetical protein [Candidatus Tisiphia endosymbiont of Psammoecus bipunctatus]
MLSANIIYDIIAYMLSANIIYDIIKVMDSTFLVALNKNII